LGILAAARARVEHLGREAALCLSVLRKICSYRRLLEEALYPGEVFTTGIEDLCLRVESAEKLSRGGCTDLQHSFGEADKALRALGRILRDVDASKMCSEARALSRLLIEVSEICIEDLRRTLREIYRYRCLEALSRSATP